MAEAKPPGPRRTAKYLRRQEEILQVAVSVLNEKGLRGMTRADVAERFGIVATGVAYYFSSKEELAAACFRRGITVYERLVAEAAKASTPAERLAHLIHGVFDLHSRVAAGEAGEVTTFDDIRALGDETVMADYVRLFQSTRALLDPFRAESHDRAARNARVHLVLQQLTWLTAWLPKYDPEEYPRAADRMVEILCHGLAVAPRPWAPPKLVVESTVLDETDSRETFLRAATQLINEQGYVGASVDRIAARLDLTKGAFYHYIDAKDDLVATCFDRTVEVIRRTQRAADKAPGDGRSRLEAVATTLVEQQLRGDPPLLRPALASLPPATHDRILAAFEHRTLHFGSMISDGIADGSLRPVDAQIAAQMVTSAVNGSAELENWLPEPYSEAPSALFLRPLFEGVFEEGTSGG